MKILDHKQVVYCNLVDHQHSWIQYLPGLRFQNKLFVKDKRFPPEQRKEAQDYGNKQFLEHKRQREYLLLKDVTGFIIWKENAQVEVLETNPQDCFLATNNLQKIIDEIRGANGIEIQDRHHNLKLYPKCFVGSQLVDWMVTHLSISSEEAVQLGQRFIDEKIIHHVQDQHDFENDYLFYRFYMDELRVPEYY